MHIITTKSGLRATIRSHGAELVSLKDGNGKEYIWDADPKFWAKHSPILFPIIGELKNGEYNIGHKTYKMSRHGFARDQDFTLIESGDNQLVFSLSQNAETMKHYPFKFELQVIYTVEDNKLFVQYRVFNENYSDMPFSIGGHPAFATPGTFEDYSIYFDYDNVLESNTLKSGLLSHKTFEIPLSHNALQLDYKLFANDALVLNSLNSRAATLQYKGLPHLKMDFDDFKNLGLWTMQDAKFICIEPWLGHADYVEGQKDFLDKKGIICLEGNSQFDAKYSIEIYPDAAK